MFKKQWVSVPNGLEMNNGSVLDIDKSKCAALFYE